MGRCNPKTNTCTRTPWWREAMGINWYGQGGGVLDNFSQLGGELLTSSSKVLSFYELIKLTGANGAAISNGNAGLVNQRNPGANDAVIVGTPVVRDLTINGETVKTLQDSSTNAISLGHNGESLFNKNKFRLKLVYQTSDGIPNAVTSNLLGGIIPTNIGLNVYVTSSGASPPATLTISYGNSDGVFQWRTDASFFQDGVGGVFIIDFDVDFDSDEVIIRNNGKVVPSSIFSGDMSTVSPGVGKWTNTANIYVGSLNNNGTSTSNPNTSSVLTVVFCDELTESESFNIDAYLYENCFKWRNEIHITNAAEALTIKNLGIAEVFNGNGLPNVTPTIANGHTGAMHIINSSDLTGFSSIDKYTYTFNDVDDFVWTNVCYLIHTSATTNGKLLVNVQGHISDYAPGHINLMNQALSEGYDVVYCTLPIASNDNTETNPTVTAQSSTGHDQILTGGLDRVGYNPLELYFFDKVSIINALASSYSTIYVVGLSGGGWTLSWLGMFLNDKISKSIICRGVIPRSFKDDLNNGNKEGDYEQGGSMFKQVRCGPRIYDLYSQISYIDMCVQHKNLLVLNHEIDTCCFKGDTFAVWRPAAYNLARTLNNKFENITLTDAAQATHGYQTDDIAQIFNHFAS